MQTERRTARSNNPWTAMKYLLERRVPGAALLSDAEGLTLVSSRLEEPEADRIAAEVWSTEGPVLHTGAGLAVRMYTSALPANELSGLHADVSRLLAAV